MILTCPACGTSYTVKDGAIPPAGRNVRCAACKHSWHQDGEAPAAIAEPPAPEPVPAPAPVVEPIVEEPAASEAAPPEPEPVAAAWEAPVEQPPMPVAPEVEEAEQSVVIAPSPDEPDSDWNDAGYGGDEPAPRRKGVKIVFALVVLIAALAAALWFLAPREWMARAGLVAANGDSPLKLMVTSQDRQKLASGNDLVSLSGRVINPTDASQPVPALQADLRDGGGKLVYSWMIAPPTARLAPRASASFNAAELGVPANATSLTLRWAS